MIAANFTCGDGADSRATRPVRLFEQCLEHHVLAVIGREVFTVFVAQRRHLVLPCFFSVLPFSSAVKGRDVTLPVGVPSHGKR
jgi:hypothetical protein